MKFITSSVETLEIDTQGRSVVRSFSSETNK